MTPLSETPEVTKEHDRPTPIDRVLAEPSDFDLVCLDGTLYACINRRTGCTVFCSHTGKQVGPRFLSPVNVARIMKHIAKCPEVVMFLKECP